jgi:hypothetical protein
MSEIAPDFDLLDVWELPVEGGRDDFGALIEVLTTLDPGDSSPISRFLFWARLRLGSLLGWDESKNQLPVPGAEETSLGERLPGLLRGSADGTVMGEAIEDLAGFLPIYRTEDEFAAELSNDTVHGVLHLSWIERGEGRFQGRLAVYAKPRGKKGEAYMLLISPFRHLFVYPALMRQVERAWEGRNRPSGGRRETSPRPLDRRES